MSSNLVVGVTMRDPAYTFIDGFLVYFLSIRIIWEDSKALEGSTSIGAKFLQEPRSRIFRFIRTLEVPEALPSLFVTDCYFVSSTVITMGEKI